MYEEYYRKDTLKEYMSELLSEMSNQAYPLPVLTNGQEQGKIYTYKIYELDGTLLKENSVLLDKFSFTTIVDHFYYNTVGKKVDNVLIVEVMNDDNKNLTVKIDFRNAPKFIMQSV